MLLLLLSRFSRVRLCATPWTAARKAPPPLGFSRQESWSGCHRLLPVNGSFSCLVLFVKQSPPTFTHTLRDTQINPAAEHVTEMSAPD